MWRTPEGTRVLLDLEAQIVRRGLDTAVYLIELGMDAGDPWPFGVPAFDALEPEQQLALLAEVGRALLCESVPAPRHTALNEAAIYVIFCALLTSIQFEIDGEEVYEEQSRRLVYAFVAATISEGEEEASTLTPECCDISEWEFEVECISDRILWDRDFELDDLIVDSSPEKAQLMKSYLGIDDDYFTSISPDPTNLLQVRRTLRQLTREKPR